MGGVATRSAKSGERGGVEKSTHSEEVHQLVRGREEDGGRVKGGQSKKRGGGCSCSCGGDGWGKVGG